MTEMMPETLPTMPYGEGSRTCAKACMAVLPPNDAMYQWLQIYLDHTAALQSRIEVLETIGRRKPIGNRTALGRIEALEKDYHELIYAVASKYEGETRHQTALRYIVQAEIRGMGNGQPALAARKDSA